MNWWALGILVYIFIDQLIDHNRRVGSGVKITDWSLANDPDFIADVAEAVKRSYVRDMAKQQQEKMP